MSGAGTVAASRAALATDSGATLELASAVTYTLTGAVALPLGVTLIGPASGSATIALAAGATLNGSTTSITLTAGQTLLIKARATNAAAFVSAASSSSGAVARQINPPMLVIGDSISAPAVCRPPILNDGNSLWVYNAFTALGGAVGAWIGQVWIDSKSTAGVLTGEVENEAVTGRLRFRYTGDTAGANSGWGEWVNVASANGGTGGFVVLYSGNGVGRIVVSVRGAVAPPAGSVGTITQYGGNQIIDYEPKTYVGWMAGRLGQRFSAYKQFAIPGCMTDDMLLFTPQALAEGPYGAALFAGGINDAPTNATQAAATLANIKAIIDLLSAAVPRVYVARPLPNLNVAYTATMNQLIEDVFVAVRNYCATKPNVTFLSAHNQLLDNRAYTRAFAVSTDMFADLLHPRCGGAAKVGYDIYGAAIERDFPQPAAQFRSRTALWNSTIKAGTINTNPSLRVSAGGTTTAAVGYSGIAAPDGWTLNRSGPQQDCALSWVAATDGGDDWYTLTLSNGDGSTYHFLQQNTNLPAGFVVGDYVQLLLEMQIGDVTGAGLYRLDPMIIMAGSGFTQTLHLFKNIEGVGAGELDITGLTGRRALAFASTPMKYTATGALAFQVRVQMGLRDAAATAEIGFRHVGINLIKV